MENSLLQSYRSVFLTLEAACIALAFASHQFFLSRGIVSLGFVGVGAAILWILVCYAKAQDVDRWRDHLLEVTNEGDLEGEAAPVSLDTELRRI